MFLNYVLLSLLLAGLCNAQILFVDLRQNFVNQNYAQRYDLTFQLENPLSTSQYMRVVFPIQLDAVTGMSASFYTDVYAVTPTVQSATIARSTITSEVSSYIYYINFPTALSAATTYTLQLFSSQVYSSTGRTSPVELYTVSSNVAGFMIIDGNPSFGCLYFNSAPAASLVVADVSGSVPANANKAGVQRTFTLQVSPTITIANSARLVLQISNSLFQVDSSTCVSPNNAANPCTITTDGVVYSISGGLSSSSSVTITVIIDQANEAAQSTITIFALHSGANLISEYYQSSATFLTTVQHDWTGNYKTLIGWGIDINGASNPPSFRIYTNGPTQTVYNTLQFHFIPTITTPSVMQQLQISLTSVSKALQSSIIHNLPAYNSNGVACSVSTTTLLVCSNIGSLTASTDYYVGVKISFANGLSGTPSMPAGFGKIGLYALLSASSTYSTNPINILGASSYPSTVAANLDRLTTLSGNLRAPMHTYPVGSSVAVAGDGVKVSSSAQALEFSLNTQMSDFTPGTYPGLEIFTAQSVITTSTGTSSTATSNCYANYGTFTTANMLKCSLIPSTIGSVASFRILFAMDSNALGADVFSSYTAFGFNNYISVSTPASFLADDRTLDLYVSAVSDMSTSPSYYTSPVSEYLLNSYTISISSSTFTGMYVLTTAFWTSNSATGESLLGYSFPAMIRIKGTLTASEASASVTKVSVFFTNLNPFVIQSDVGLGSPRVGCATILSSATCRLSVGDSSSWNYINQNRIDITIPISTSFFDVIIPVATIANTAVIELSFATTTSSHAVPSNSLFGDISKSKIISSTSFSTIGGTSSDFFDVSSTYIQGMNYLLDTTNQVVGSTATASIDVYHYDSSGGTTNLPNAAGAQSAAFLYVTRWQFYSSSSAITSSTVTNTESCIPFTYYYPSDTTYPNRYGLFCPINGNINMLLSPASIPQISITNFIFPSTEGTNLPLSYSVVASNLGIVAAYQNDFRTNALTANTITVNSISPSLYRSETSSTLLLTFTTQTSVPGNSVFRMTTVGNPWYFLLKQGYSCFISTSTVDVYTTIFSQNCQQALNTTQITFTLLTSSTTYPAGQLYLYIYEVDVSASVLSPSQAFVFQHLTSSLKLIAQTSTNPSINFLTNNRNLVLSVASFSIGANSFYSESYLSLTFQTLVKPIPRGTYLDLNFYTGSDQLTLGNSLCRVRDASGLFASGFQLCTISTQSLSLYLELDLPISTLYSIVLEGIKIGSLVNNPTFQLVDKFSNVIESGNTALSYPSYTTVPANFTSVVIGKRANSALITPEFRLTMDLPVPVDSDSVILVRFPAEFYSPPSNTNPPICYFAGYQVNCYYDEQFTITITDFPVTTTPGDPFQLDILGPKQTQFSSSNALNIIIYYMVRSAPTQVLYVYRANDIAPQTIVSQNLLQIQSLTYSSALILVSGTMTTTFILTSGSAVTSPTVFVDFPHQYTNILHNTTVTVTLSQGGTTIVNAQSVVMKGFRCEINLVGQTLALNSQIQLKVANLNTPETQEYPAPALAISVLAADNVTVDWTSATPIDDYSQVAFITSSTQQYLSVVQIVNYTTVTMSDDTPLQATLGVWSPRIQIMPASGGRFQSNLQFNITKQGNIWFDTSPSTLLALVGESYLEFRILFQSPIAADLFSLPLTFAETSPVDGSTTSLYANAPPLLLRLSSSPSVIYIPYFDSNTLITGQGGLSFPVEFDFTDMIPPNGLTITAYVPPLPDLGLSIYPQTQFLINTTTTWATFTILNNGNSSSSATITTLSFYITGTDSAYYTIQQTILTISLQSVSATLPTITYSYSATTPNQVGVSSTQVGYIYYQAVGSYSQPSDYWDYDSTSYTDNLAITDVRNRALYNQNYQDNTKLRTDEFVGKMIYTTVGPLQYFTINGLRASTTYNVTIWGVNLLNNVSTPSTFQITTASNGGSFFRLEFTFNGNLSTAAEQNLVSCWINYYLQVPYSMVTNYQGFSCNDTRVESNILNSAISRRMLQIQNGGSYTYYYYVYPFDMLASDTVYSSASTEVSNGNMQTQLQAVATTQGYPSLNAVAITQITPIKPIITPSNASAATINVTSHSITLSEVTLSAAGYIWMAVDSAFTPPDWTFTYAPDPSDFKYLLYNTNSYQAASTVVYTAANTAAKLNISGLNSSTTYDVFWFGMDEDPGYRNSTTVVFRTRVTTPSFGAVLRPYSVASVILIFLCVVF